MFSNRAFFRKLVCDPVGQSATDLLMSVGLSAGIILAGVSFIANSVSQYKLTSEELEAQQDLMMAAFYIKSYFAQSVKVRCSVTGITANTLAPVSNVAGGSPWPAGLQIPQATEVNVLPDLANPAGLPLGSVDCRLPAQIGQPPGSLRTLGLFTREVGRPVGGAIAASAYRATGIFFKAPQSGTSAGLQGQGEIYISQENLGAALSSNQSIKFGHIVDVRINPRGVVTAQLPKNTPATSANALGPLIYISMTITARYFFRNDNKRDWTTGICSTSNTSPCKDIEVTMTIPFRNNFLGDSLTSGTFTGASGARQAERAHGGIYFYDFVGPSLVALSN